MRQFYENLYKKQENTDIEDTSLNPIKEGLNKINEVEKTNLDENISMEELGNVVKNRKIIKALDLMALQTSFIKYSGLISKIFY